MGRRDDADIDWHWAAATEALDFAILQHAEQLDLRAQAELADFVEENRPAARPFKPAGFARRGSGVSAALVAE